MQDSICPRILTLGSMFGFGTSHDPDVAPSAQTSAEQFTKAMKQFGVKSIHDASAENHPQE
jgi:hypothetical protein